jgi:NhaB family Na+:H+ antiporter
MAQSVKQAFVANFLGNAPHWYKLTVIAFLIITPLLYWFVSPFVAGWVLIIEFIFTLAMALKCYPLLPGGLLALEAVVIGMTSTETVYHETLNNFPVILLLIFMVAGIYFMKDLLLFLFTRLLLGIRSKVLLSLLFCGTAAFLSAFLDALTVVAVLISVCTGFYAVYHRVASGQPASTTHDHNDDSGIGELHRSDLDQFRSFLRCLVMHGAVGTALGGVCTKVGEPQNLLIAEKMGWEFGEFFLMMAPVTMPVLAAGLLCCVLLELTGRFGYGAKLPINVRAVLVAFAAEQDRKRDLRNWLTLGVQTLAALFLIAALALHLAEVGLIGLTIIVLQTALNGINDEHQIGRAFTEALPFTALLVVFFSVVAVIHDQHLFAPLIDAVLSLEGHFRTAMLFIANGLLSAISDNVFVATVYINEVRAALEAGSISAREIDHLAVAINTGTNIPSVATPNGQAAFLFLLTSALAPLIRLSYMRMVWMALPYTATMSGVALISVALVL